MGRFRTRQRRRPRGATRHDPPDAPSGLAGEKVSDTSVSVTWDAVAAADLDVYTVHYGQTSGSYSSALDVGTGTDVTLTGLEAGEIYFIAVTARDTTGNVSGYSEEVQIDLVTGEVEVNPPAENPTGGDPVSGEPGVTPPGGVVDPDSLQLGQGLNVIPNVVLNDGEFEIAYLGSRALAGISIYSLQGALVTALGEETGWIPSSELPGGIYIVQADVVGTAPVSAKVLLVRTK